MMDFGRKALFPAVFLALILLATPLAAGCLEATSPAGETASGGEGPDLQAELQSRVEYVAGNNANLAADIHDLINAERAENGLEPLRWDPTLARIAFAHSKDMAERDYFDHLSPEGNDFADRYEKAGYHLDTRVGDVVYTGGENLYLGSVVRSYTYDQETNDVYEYIYNDLDDLARSAVEGWMESEGHRENILTPFTREGIGVYVTPDGEVYITENFS
jgi:uncharacterized protein YkwD